MTKPRAGIGHLGRLHPLARVAAQHCDRHGVPVVGRIGRVACGACWERAIRDDEKVAVEHELPRELTPDPDYVDEVAVRQACRGERVQLTGVERRAAARQLATQGLTNAQIASRLRMSYTVVAEVLPAAAVTVAARCADVRGELAPVAGGTR